MPCYLAIDGKEFEALFLGLYEQHFVERVFMENGSLQGSGRVTWGHRQENDVLIFKQAEHEIRVERTLSFAGAIEALEFQSHLPDRHGAYINL